MKESNFRILILLALFYPVLNCFGQTDSTEIKKREPDFVNDKFQERGSMFYIGGNPKGKDVFAFEPQTEFIRPLNTN